MIIMVIMIMILIIIMMIIMIIIRLSHTFSIGKPILWNGVWGTLIAKKNERLRLFTKEL